MEYEKHIKRLVLGYLKYECRGAYKLFRRSHFQCQTKHIATRVAGQTLEEILKIYSRIQDIVQGRLEDTDYYKEYGNDVSSPNYLPDQLIYLLEKQRPFTPTSTLADRSPIASSNLENNCDNEEQADHSDLETTPENALPGNHQGTEDSCHNKTPFQEYNPVIPTPLLENLPASEQKNLSTVVTQKLLKKKDFHEKLAQTITTALNTSENDRQSLIDDVNALKRALDQTEADPIFDDLLDEFLGPVCSTIGRGSNSEITPTIRNEQSKNSTNTKNKKDEGRKLPPTEKPNNETETNSSQPTGGAPVQVQTPISLQQPPVAGALNFPAVVNVCANQQQQQQPFYIVNQPIVVQPVQTIHKPNTRKRGAAQYTDQDILAMPSIFINERNEVIYDSSTTSGNRKEVNNIAEYLNVYDTTKQSPLIKHANPVQKAVITKQRLLKPTPTIKVEYYKHDTHIPLDKVKIIDVQTISSALPELNVTSQQSKATESTSNDNQVTLAEPDSFSTPLVEVPALQKPTPKSGSHVRNLTFPSPIRKSTTNEKTTDENRVSISAANKEQATKDLFKNQSEEEKGEANKQDKEQIQARASPRSKKSTKISSKTEIAKENKGDNCWDASLRKMTVQSEESGTVLTPSKRANKKKRFRSTTELDITESDGKKLEEALRTPKVKRHVKKKLAGKTVLSPSKLCNTATKRNMEVDGVHPKEGALHLVSSARKNISNLLKTPLKNEGKSKEPQNLNPEGTPFTPMLKANLQGIASGDIFTIETPDFPVTPGMNILETTGAAYCMLNDSEKNKATDAIVLSEERKSSVRKTDDEDMELGQQAYEGNKILEKFNKAQIGKKNLELVENVGHNDSSSSSSSNTTTSNSSDSSINQGEEEICKSPEMNCPIVDNNRRITRSAGKLLSQMKHHMLDDHMEEIETTTVSEQPNTPKASKNAKLPSPDPSGNSSESEIRPEKLQEVEIPDNVEQPKNEPPTKVDEEKVPENKTIKQTSKNPSNRNGKTKKKMVKFKQEESIKNSNDSAISAEEIRKTILNAEIKKLTGKKNVTNNLSNLKKEIEEKRKRMVEIEKARTQQQQQATKNRRKPFKIYLKLGANKRKSKSPVKMLRRKQSSESKNDDRKGKEEKTYSQDEFFKNSGSNLHRKNKETSPDKDLIEEEGGPNKAEEQLDETAKEPVKSAKQAEIVSDRVKDSVVSKDKADENYQTFWDECSYCLYAEEIAIVYDETKPSNKSLSDYKCDLSKKRFSVELPLIDDTIKKLEIAVTPFKLLFELGEGSGNNKNSDEIKCSKKRKERSNSSSSNSSKKLKTGLKPSFLNEVNIQKVLTKLHGPSEKA